MAAAKKLAKTVFERYFIDMGIYTKKGDLGETGLPGKRRLSKNAMIFNFLGQLDSLNAQIGLTLSLLAENNRSQLTESLQQTQRILLGIGAATAAEQPGASPVLQVLESSTSKLEKLIDLWDKQLPPLTNFILPGGSVIAAHLHLCRTATRSAERAYHLLEPEQVITSVSMYLNRLSDFFFQAARWQNQCEQTPDIIWKNEF